MKTELPSEIVMRGESLNLLVRQYPTCFHQQTWFWAEPFAQESHTGTFERQDWPWPAAVCAAFFIQQIQQHGGIAWADEYVWTSDVDSKGQRVYIGRAAEYGGLQVHRHLTPEIV